jgi:tRNA nucleotidyltransferase (CCA-adding enzyme)
MAFPRIVSELATVVRQRGGRALIIGGSVRDWLLGLEPKDIDVEVFGLTAGQVRETLSSLGELSETGAAFQVFKLTTEEATLDVSLPRRESKRGEGHRGFEVTGDPTMTVEEAARRRDFTLNAIGLDPVTGDVIDPVGGRADLGERLLRVVDPRTFVEDSLRVLRGAQLAARFDLTIDPGSRRLMSAIPLDDLAAERIFEEFHKGLLRAPRAGRFLSAMRELGVLDKLLPMLSVLYQTPQEPEFHPEGDVGVHTEMVLDVASGLIRQERFGLTEAEQLTIMLAALCHDLGKPSTTEVVDGRIRQYRHDVVGLQPTEALLNVLHLHRYKGMDVRAAVLKLVERHLQPGFFGRKRDEVTDGAYRRLAREVRLDLLYVVAVADCLGRGVGGALPGRRADGSLFTTEEQDYFFERAVTLDLRAAPPAPPLLTGAHLIAMGLEPGPLLGSIKRDVYERQLDGEITTLEQALQYGRRLVSRSRSSAT